MAAQQRKTGLGRGLGALLNDSTDLPERNSDAEISRIEAPKKSKESGNISTEKCSSFHFSAISFGTRREILLKQLLHYKFITKSDRHKTI